VRVDTRGLAASVAGQPNRIDLARIARALLQRQRYRYVAPVVAAVPDGYEVSSPNCSRNVDPAGGVIPIARLQPRAGGADLGWTLLHHDHHVGAWRADSEHARLADAVARLNHDPRRIFWP
jgi:hypothetical protein